MDHTFQQNSSSMSICYYTYTGQTTFQYSAAADWNSFPKCIRDITSLKRFKTELYGYFRELDVKSHCCSLT